MSHNTFGHLFRVTTWGESHGPAIGCVIDGCPPGVPLTEDDIQPYLDKVGAQDSRASRRSGRKRTRSGSCQACFPMMRARRSRQARRLRF